MSLIAGSLLYSMGVGSDAQGEAERGDDDLTTAFVATRASLRR